MYSYPFILWNTKYQFYLFTSIQQDTRQILSKDYVRKNKGVGFVVISVHLRHKCDEEKHGYCIK